MARTKQKYANGSSRGEKTGKACDTSHGAPGNKNRTRKDCAKVARKG